MAIQTKSSRVYMQNRGLQLSSGRSDTPISQMNPSANKALSLPVDPTQQTLLAPLLDHDMNDPDHASTNW